MSERTPAHPRQRTQEERSESTKTKLLDATIKCLVELGYSNTTTIRVSQYAGVSRGGQLHHFPTRNHLVAAAIEQFTHQLASEFAKQLELVDLSADGVGSLIDSLWSVYTTPVFGVWLELLMASRTDPELRLLLDPVEERLDDLIYVRLDMLLGGGAEARLTRQIFSVTVHLFNGIALSLFLSGSANLKRRLQAEAILPVWREMARAVVSVGVAFSTATALIASE